MAAADVYSSGGGGLAWRQQRPPPVSRDGPCTWPFASSAGLFLQEDRAVVVVQRDSFIHTQQQNIIQFKSGGSVYRDGRASQRMRLIFDGNINLFKNIFIFPSTHTKPQNTYN